MDDCSFNGVAIRDDAMMPLANELSALSIAVAIHRPRSAIFCWRMIVHSSIRSSKATRHRRAAAVLLRESTSADKTVICRHRAMRDFGRRGDQAAWFAAIWMT